MENIEIEELAFKGNHRGYVFTATHLTKPKGQALIQIEKEGKMVKEFLFPAYKIFNIIAHRDDIVNGLEQGSNSGLREAGSDGLGGNVFQE